jgi:tetratricopeptide (TPR) repeat protein
VSGRFDELMDLGREALAKGDFESAEKIYLQAFKSAQELGNVDDADLAFCSHCSVLLELDRGTDQIPMLKEILLRSTSTKNRFHAAYCTAVAYDISGDSDKAQSYADRATAFADQLGDPVSASRSFNLAGSLSIRSSKFPEAEGAFIRSLEAHRNLDGLHRMTEAQVRDNLGYVMMCTERLEEGINLCEQARSDLERIGADHYLYETLQDLCYGHLLADNFDRAQECGERALDLAVDFEDDQVAKNCLFLLSETAVRRGDTFRARRYLRELTAYYPEVGISEELIDVFLATDLTSVVNLRG